MDPDSGPAGLALTPRIHRTAYIAAGVQIVGDVRVGAYSSVWFNAVLRGDNDRIDIGESTNVQDGVIVHVDEGVPCVVGDRVGIGHRAIVHGCTIENDTLIGMGAILMNGVRVGGGSVVGAGALLPEGMDVPAGSLVMGVPARIVRSVDDELRRRIERNSRHYVWLASEYRERTFL